MAHTNSSTTSAVPQELAGATGHCLPAFPLLSCQAGKVHSRCEGMWSVLPSAASHLLCSQRSAGKEEAAAAVHGACLPPGPSSVSRAVQPLPTWDAQQVGSVLFCGPRVCFCGQTSAFVYFSSL